VIAVRRLAVIAGFGMVALAFVSLPLLGLQSCAHVASPRGGPPDTMPPVLLRVEPDSLAVVTDFRGNRGQVRFEFDEPISERNILGSVVLYPFELRPRTEKGKRDLRVRPRSGWVEDRIYHVFVRSVIQDYFSNPITAPIRYVFSTGVPIPQNGATGTVYDRITGQVHRSARIDMVLAPDTLRYGTVADSIGGFSLMYLPEGEYLAIGYEDVNNNQRADEFDRSDTLRVTLGSVDTLSLDFRVFRHDTVGAVLAQVEVLDSLTLALGFDQYLDPDAALSVSDIEVLALPDSAGIALDTVLHQWQYLVYLDSIRALELARLDSIAAAEAAEDSARAAAGDTAAVDTAAAPLPVPPGRRTRPQASAATEPEAPRELPDQRIIVITVSAIPPGSYVVRAVRILNLSGMEGGGEAGLEVEAPESESPQEEPPGPGGG
jgi:hypothetical protein